MIKRKHLEGKMLVGKGTNKAIKTSWTIFSKNTKYIVYGFRDKGTTQLLNTKPNISMQIKMIKKGCVQ